VEDIVDLPVVGELESVGNVGHFGKHFERSILSWCKFHGFVWEFQVGAFKPDFVIFFEWFVFCFLYHSILGGLQGF
jgi:hypothetical protein